MNAVSGFILFWGVSIAGYLAGRRLKIPAPAILGPIACFLVLTILGVKFTIPAWQKPVLSVITGILLGMRFNQNFKGVLCQMLLAAIWLVSLSLIATGVLIFTGLEKETALFAATPGGM
ncbi:AbrB family transcriptional regulator, partial [Anaerotignum faecicola]